MTEDDEEEEKEEEQDEEVMEEEVKVKEKRNGNNGVGRELSLGQEDQDWRPMGKSRRRCLRSFMGTKERKK